jgi:hypothetical protein
MRDEYQIDYAAGLRTFADASLEETIGVIRREMPQAWITRYHRMCNGPTNILEVSLQDFSYLFDYCTELADAGELPAGAREDRALLRMGSPGR